MEELMPCRVCGRVPYVSGTFRFDRTMYEVLHRCESGNMPITVAIGPCRGQELCVTAWNRLMGGDCDKG